jgi:hypothetical protein
MNQRELREALRGHPDAVARERAWRVVQAAYREQPVPRRSRGWVRLVAVVAALTVVGGAAVAAATTPRSGVGRLVRDVLGIGAPHPRAALVRVPGGGRLLVQEGRSIWVVASDGTRRRLGSYDGAAWSPRGLFVVAWRGDVLTAVDPAGKVHWSLSRPARVRAARWSPVDGFRIAYLSGHSLRIVNGDGTGDHRYGAALTAVAPAWRPDAAHVLAYVDARRRVEVVAVDTRRRLWRSDRIGDPVALAWSASGRRLLVLERRGALLYDATGRRIAARPIAAAGGAAWSPRAAQLAVVRVNAAARTSELVLLDAARGLRARSLFSGPGRFGTPAWSPDGRSVLLPWPDAGQWLFLRPARSGRPVAIANIARQFAPGAARPRFPGEVSWCCAPEH